MILQFSAFPFTINKECLSITERTSTQITMSTWINIPSSEKILFFSPRGFGGHGNGCRCMLEDDQRDFNPKRVIEVILNADCSADYRYLRFPKDENRHWLRIDYSKDHLEILQTVGAIEGIEVQNEFSSISYRGPVCIDYKKRSMVKKIHSEHYNYNEKFLLKGTLKMPDCLSIHGPHRTLSAIKARSICCLSADTIHNLRPGQVCPGFFFSKCQLEATWELEYDENASNPESFMWTLDNFVK